MTHDPSRKRFFASLFGFAAAFSVVPRLLAKVPAAGPAADRPGSAAPVAVHPDTRAVARRDGAN